MRNKIVLVTGGTGSLGQELVKYLQSRCKKVIVYSRDEFKQVEMKRNILDPRKKIRYFIGDVRDRKRLERALTKVDYVIHAAALKHVDVCEYNPEEAIETNINGTKNVANAAIDKGIEKVICISSDKACMPINVYGATKLCSERLALAFNAYSGVKGTKFSVIRFGNFEGSRGSILPYFSDLYKRGRPLPITDKRMTRYFIPFDEAVKFTYDCLKVMKGGETFIPKMKLVKIVDLINERFPGAKIKEVGIRPGEKLHEVIDYAE